MPLKLTAAVPVMIRFVGYKSALRSDLLINFADVYNAHDFYMKQMLDTGYLINR